MTATMSAMIAIVRVFIEASDRGRVDDPGRVKLRPGAGIPFPAAARLQSFGSYGSSTPRATRTIRRSG